VPIGMLPPRTGWTEYVPYSFDTVVRVHDLGFEELLALLPITGVAIALFGRLRPGLVAAGAALVYAIVRFGLDFLRVEPHAAGLTVGQWCCFGLAAIGIGASINALSDRGKMTA